MLRECAAKPHDLRAKSHDSRAKTDDSKATSNVCEPGCPKSRAPVSRTVDLGIRFSLTARAKQGNLARSPSPHQICTMKKTLLALVLTLVISWATVKFVLFAAWQAQNFFGTLSATGQWAVVAVQLVIGVAALAIVGVRTYRRMRRK
jgi:hypothetical protein